MPLRTRRIQTFGNTPVLPLEAEVLPPVLVRRWKRNVPLGDTPMNAFFDPDVRVSRIITPALALTEVLSIEAMRALISPSALKV